MKSHYFGLLTSVLVLLSLFLGYSWGMSNNRSNINNDGTSIEEGLNNDQNVSDTPVVGSYTGIESTKNESFTPNTTPNSNGKSVIINSEKIRPIPKDTKPADRPLYFFY